MKARGQSLGALCLALSPFASQPAFADCPPQPIAKQGACPSNYYASGAYCVPSRGARPVIAKNGPCPSGYYASGAYCVASSNGQKQVIPKHGSCPSGWFSSGQYCIKSS